jgi:hypothetical protein
MHVTTFPRFSVTQFTSLPNNQLIGHLWQQINAAASSITSYMHMHRKNDLIDAN